MRTMRWLLATGVAAAVGLGVAGCQDGGSPTGPPGGGGGGGGGTGITIGPAGGTVISSDGNFTLTIPAGALDAATTVTVTKVDASTLNRVEANPVARASSGPSLATASLAATQLVARTLGVSSNPLAATAPVYIAGTGYKVEPEALALKVAASVQIKYDAASLPSGFDPQLLRIRRRDRTQDQWQDCLHLGVQGNQVQARVMNFATFALYGWPAAPSGSTGTLVGPAGGTVTSADGNFILTIPAGALEATTQIVVTKEDVAAQLRVAASGMSARAFSMSSGPLAAVTPVYMPGTGYKVEPEDMVLKQPASVKIKFDPGTLPSGFDPQLLRIRRRDRAQNQWQDCTHTGVQGNFVEASADRLSTFALYGTPKEAPTASVVHVSPGTLDVETGDVVQLTAQALDDAGNVLDVPVTWSVDNPTVATVDAAGLLTALTDGTTSVTATAGGKQGSAGLTVSRKVGSVTIGNLPTELIAGESAQLVADVRDPTGAPVPSPTVTWTSLTPGVATVDATGKVTGVSVGETSIIAGSRTKADTARVTVSPTVAEVTISAVPTEVIEGESAQLVADVVDVSGNKVSNAKVTWTSLTPTVATVDGTGKVTGVSAGSTSIVASSQKKSDTVSVTVSPNVASIVISGTSSKPLSVGKTLQLTATAYNTSGQVITATIKWTSNNDAIATVSSTGLVTGTGSGTATITASAARATASVDIRVTGGDEGGEETTTGNNLSWPVVFADGTGITGLAVATDPGIRPLTTESAAYAELTAVAPTDPMTAFFYTGNVVDAASGYYLQGTASTWRAQIVDGTGKPAYNASIYWGDNIAGGTGNLAAGHPIRVEVALSTTDGVSLLGYNMPYVVNASSPDEIQGTDGTTLSQVPLIYSPGVTLIIEQLDGPGGRVVATVSSAEYKAEINVGGRIIYGAQFKPTVAGTYRLRFVLASDANVNITAIGNAAGSITIVSPKESAIEVQVTA
jgi:uncharacterized protein YjdB